VLGWAYYRAGDYPHAIEALEQSMALQTNPKGGDPWQWFFLAMAHGRLGHREEARKWYDQSVRWLIDHDARNEEANRFRAEAAALLKLDVGKKGSISK
jgi:tetratricopeptide (TPR) repeat protein